MNKCTDYSIDDFLPNKYIYMYILHTNPTIQNMLNLIAVMNFQEYVEVGL